MSSYFDAEVTHFLKELYSSLWEWFLYAHTHTVENIQCLDLLHSSKNSEEIMCAITIVYALTAEWMTQCICEYAHLLTCMFIYMSMLALMFTCTIHTMTKPSP